ncbi:cupin domain-containing protein [Flavobacterium sp. TP390]|uniref:Cupin domain-containing protein n=1 Tax=Flavobacterium profundi TaxID=1774945 RepID=A0A6I4IFA9_9FLAO|nr:cupin domain-containing protein [Flavobacterium profundi]MVO08268.1 cupin domain-containing protein [Flavobacterium profundi]
MSRTTLFFNDDSISWEYVTDKIQRKIMGFDETMMMVKVQFETGGIGTLHSHEHTQITYITEGVFEVIIENETKTLQGGDSFFIPSNVRHGVICKKAGILIDVFHPMRNDFITNET